jgi:hypothetical protein
MTLAPLEHERGWLERITFDNSSMQPRPLIDHTNV